MAFHSVPLDYGYFNPNRKPGNRLIFYRSFVMAEEIMEATDKPVDVDDVIGDIVGGIPDDEETPVPEQVPDEPVATVTEPVAPAEPAESTTPVEDTPAEPDDEAPAKDYTPREQALYARMNKYKTRAQASEAEAADVKTQVAELRGRVDGINQVQPQDQTGLVNPIAELDPGDIVTAEQLREYGQYMFADQQQAQEKANQERFGHIGNTGAEMYDDWQDVIAKVLPQVFNNPQVAGQLASIPHPARAARFLYEYAKKSLPEVPKPPSTNPVDDVLNTITNTPKIPSQVLPKTNVNWARLTKAQQEKVTDAIHLCQSDEQIDELMKRLGLG